MLVALASTFCLVLRSRYVIRVVSVSMIIELAIKNPAPPQMDAVIVSLGIVSLEQHAMTSSMAPTTQAMAQG